MSARSLLAWEALGIIHLALACSSHLNILLGQEQIAADQAPLHILREDLSSSASLRWRSLKSITSAARWLTAPLSTCSCVLFSSLPFHLAPRLLGIRGTFALRGERWPDSHSIWPGLLGKMHLSCSPELQDVFGWSGNSSIHLEYKTPVSARCTGSKMRKPEDCFGWYHKTSL